MFMEYQNAGHSLLLYRKEKKKIQLGTLYILVVSFDQFFKKFNTYNYFAYICRPKTLFCCNIFFD